jgi:hypothetical protein
MASNTKTKAKPPTAPPADKKSNVSARQEKGKEVATSDDLTKLMEQDSGRGVSTAAEDNIIPLIYILQAQSPVAMKQKQEYIKGAEAGNIWPRGTKTLIDGENDGLSAIPVAFSKWWMEWRPERGGLVARHPYRATAEDKGRPTGTEWEEDPKNPGMGKWQHNGNDVIETREHVVLAKIKGEWQGYVVAMSGSNHTASRSWMGLMKSKKIPGSDKRAASFAYVYTMKTIPKTNDKGDWYGWQIEDGLDGDGEVTFVGGIDGGPELYKIARQLAADFEAGTKVADIGDPDETGGTSTDNSGEDDKHI